MVLQEEILNEGSEPQNMIPRMGKLKIHTNWEKLLLTMLKKRAESLSNIAYTRAFVLILYISYIICMLIIYVCHCTVCTRVCGYIHGSSTKVLGSIALARDL